MSKDPYRYFRVEARELVEGLTQGVLELEKDRAAPDLVARLLRLAHTLKGAARVVKQPAIAELAHAAESALAGHRGAEQSLPSDRASELLGLFDRISVVLRSLEPPSSSGVKTPAEPSTEERPDTVRVEISETDSLLHGLSESLVRVGAIRRELSATARLRDLARMLSGALAPQPVENGRASAGLRVHSLMDELQSELDRFLRGLVVDVERLEAGLTETQDLAQRLRLISAQTLFPMLDRAVRDAAEALGKQVDFEVHGGDVQLDLQVLAALRGALMHAVRNAVTHGIESPTERVAVGKSSRGLVRLVVERRGGRASFVCQDDGRGVDLDAVRAAAIALGIASVATAQALTADEVLSLLRAGGLSTSANLTELSGRGIGLDVVRATTSRLKGEFHLRSEPGRGATLEVQVPTSIASLQGLVVEVSGTSAAIPLDSISQTLRVNDAEIARSVQSQSIVHQGKVIPFLPLDRILRRSGSTSRRRRAWSAVVVYRGSQQVAVGVDRLLGTASIVMRSLPAVLEVDSVIAGASLDAEGNPQLVLDPSGLVTLGESNLGLAREPTPTPRAPVLVLDDSLTTRMLEQSILESAGYEVELAGSAEEGLAKACERAYSLFLVDLEMPGMNGFDFVTTARADPRLRGIPAILVTSRNTPEDRQRGEQVGARAYIVKGEFDQGHLLKTIRRLIG